MRAASDHYIIQHLNDAEPRRVTRSDVNVDLGTKVAILKCVEDGKHVDDVGFRLDANTFFVLDTVQS